MSRWWSLLPSRRREKELEEEIQAHLSMARQDRIDRGETPHEAEANARREFGNLTSVKEVTREMWGWSALDAFLRDLRYAARALMRSPGFTIVALLTLALGIGANTAIFSVVNVVLLKPLPFRDSDGLVQVWTSGLRAGGQGDWSSFPDYVDWRQENDVFEEMAAYRTWLFTLSGDAPSEAMPGFLTTSRFFDLLGVQPLLGRTFLPDEDQPGRNRVVILSYGLWRRRFEANPAVVGRSVTINGSSYTVIGVMPAGFRFLYAYPDVFELYMPTQSFSDQQDRDSHNYYAIGRLKPGVTVEQARINMRLIGRNLARHYPSSNKDLDVMVTPFQEHMARAVHSPLLVILGAVGLVLLIACANVASLVLARSNARTREMVVRTALGASRGRLLRQNLAESLLLGALGGACAVLLVQMAMRMMRTFGPDEIPRLGELSVDWRVLVFTLFVSLATATILGLVPAISGSRPAANEALRESGMRTTTSRGSGRVRSALVVAEIALALMLAVGAGLMIRSFSRLLDVDTGFDPSDVLVAYVMSPPQSTNPTAFFEQVLERVREIPGVEAVGASATVPLTGWNHQGGFGIEGRPDPPPGVLEFHANRPRVSPGYLEAMRMTMLRGRWFTDQDRAGAPDVAVISDVTARRYWPGEDPIGQRVSLDERDGKPVWREIIGIVQGVTHFGLDVERVSEIYVPYSQSPQDAMGLVVRTRRPVAEMTASIRRETRAADANGATFRIQTMEQLMAAAQSKRRFHMVLLVAFAGLALILAAVGVYGVVAFSVVQRTHEVGIRIALGAGQGQVLGMVVRQGLGLAIAGVALGIAGAFALTRLMSSLLFGITVTDPLTFVTASSLLLLVAAIACAVPALRATRVDPLTALRYE